MAEFTKAILPGQEGKITLKVNTQNMSGGVRKSATVLTNDPEHPKISISMTCKIKSFIMVSPSLKVALQGYYGDNLKQTVIITSLEDKPFEITGIKSNIEKYIDYKLKILPEAERKCSLQIKTRDGLKESFRGKVVLKTNSTNKPEINLYVIGKLKNSLKITPAYVFFGIIDSNSSTVNKTSLERTITISNAKNNKFTVEEITPTVEWISTQVTPVPGNSSEYTITIKIDKDKPGKGDFREKVNIRTKSVTGNRMETGFVLIEGKVI